MKAAETIHGMKKWYKEFRNEKEIWRVRICREKSIRKWGRKQGMRMG